jgi:hypothetical protein
VERTKVTPAAPTHGWILLCNNGSQDEYLRNGLIGLKEQYLSRLQSLQQGDPVLLYNFESSQLVAFLFASGKPGMDIRTEGSFKKYRAQVPVRLEVQFDPPIGREKLQTIPDLYFDARGYLVNFTVPMELVLSIVDMAAGRKATSHEPAAREEVDFRRKFPPKFLCSDGHWVRSKAELLVDNWLYTRRPPIAHAYERRLPVEEEAYADFYIPVGDCYIEYWGLDTPEYTDRQQRKLELYDRYKFRVISLREHDIEKLDDLLPVKLLKLFPREFRFQ